MTIEFPDYSKYGIDIKRACEDFQKQIQWEVIDHKDLHNIVNKIQKIANSGYGVMLYELFWDYFHYHGYSLDTFESISDFCHLMHMLTYNIDDDGQLYICNVSFGPNVYENFVFFCDTPLPPYEETKIEACKCIYSRLPNSWKEELEKNNNTVVLSYHSCCDYEHIEQVLDLLSKTIENTQLRLEFEKVRKLYNPDSWSTYQTKVEKLCSKF